MSYIIYFQYAIRNKFFVGRPASNSKALFETGDFNAAMRFSSIKAAEEMLMGCIKHLRIYTTLDSFMAGREGMILPEDEFIIKYIIE